MKLFVLFYAVSPRKTWYVFILSSVSGVTGGLFLLTLLEAAHTIVEGQSIRYYVFFLPLLTIGFILSKALSQHYATQLAEQVLQTSLLDITNSIRQLSLREMEQRDRSEIYAAMADVQSITQTTLKSAEILHATAILLTCWLYLFSLAPFAALILLAAFWLVYLAGEVREKLVGELLEMQRTRETDLFTLIQHLLKGFQELKLDPRKNNDVFYHYLTPLISEVRGINKRVKSYHIDYETFMEMVYWIVTGLFVFVLIRIYAVPVILSILTISFYLYKPISILTFTTRALVSGMAAIERLVELQEELKSKGETRLNLYKPELRTLDGFQMMSFEQICFEYTQADGSVGFSIGPLSLTVKSGEICFITGGNGSGKTTLMKLLTGLYAPSSGSIAIDNTPVSLTEYRYLFAAIFSDAHLFEGIYGVEALDDRKVNTLLLQMGLAGKTRWRNKRFTTLDLSAGQRKRLALVVALMEDKPVYVFDEWAADQAPDFRTYFYEDVLPSLRQQGKTIIVVSHDDRYYGIADQIIKMEYEQIIDRRV